MTDVTDDDDKPNPFRFVIPTFSDNPCGARGCPEIVHGLPQALCPRHALEYEVERWATSSRDAHRYAVETIPKNRLWATFGAPELATRVTSAATIKSASAAVQEGRSALIIGPSGVGKTSLAVAMLQAHLAKAALPPEVSLSARGTPARELAEYHLRRAGSSRFLRATKLQYDWWCHGFGQGECATVTEALRADLLVVDDLGIEKRSDIMVRVLKDRAEDGRQTIVTTSKRPKDPDSIEAIYGEGVWRAITDGAAYLELHERTPR